MNNIKYNILLAVCFMFGCKAFEATVSHEDSGVTVTVGGSRAQVINPENWYAEWDPVTKRTDGTDCTDLKFYEFAIGAEDSDVKAGGAVLQSELVGAPVTRIDMAVFVPIGTGSYRIWIRAVDDGGDSSVWYGPVPIVFGEDAAEPDGIAPEMPRNLRWVKKE